MSGLITAEAEKTRVQIDNSLKQWQREIDFDAAVSRIISSLSFPDMYKRQNQIKLAHTKTFEWVFEIQGTTPWDDFVEWIHQGTSPYWILGKPGCGKSTFMKFLTSHPDTRSHMTASFGGPGDPHILSFYFWGIGGPLQKTTTGLLLTLLHQLLSQERELLKTLVNSQRDLSKKLTASDWEQQQLVGLLETLLKATQRPVFVLIDGLDEFDSSSDDIDDLLELLEIVNHCPGTRICISSRPSQLFIDMFGQYPKLRLQDLTRRDIESYVQDTLRKKLESRRLTKVYTSENIDYFTSAVVERAEGVFLWAYVALKRILQSLTDRADLDALHGRLNDLPKDMKDLYEHMWKRLNEDTKAYRDEAAIFFTYILLRPKKGIDGGSDPSLFELMVATDKQVRHIYLGKGMLMTSEELKARCENTKIRLLTRCAGLLEVFDASEEPGFVGTIASSQQWLSHYSSSTRVALIHATAREFLLGTRAGRDILANRSLTGPEVSVKALEARSVSILHGMEAWRKEVLFELLNAVIKYGRSETVELLNVVDRVGQLMQSSRGTGGMVDDWSHQFIIPKAFNNEMAFMAMDFLGLTAEFGFDQYVSHRLDSTSLPFTRRYKDYLLLCASTASRVFSQSTLHRIRTWELLLRHGADVNARFFLADIGPFIITPWTNLLASGERRDDTLGNRHRAFIDAAAFDRGVALFVKHGADLSADLFTFHFLKENPETRDSLKVGCSDPTWLRLRGIHTTEPSDSDRFCVIKRSNPPLIPSQDDLEVQRIPLGGRGQIVHVQYGPLGLRVDDPADARDLLRASRALARWLDHDENLNSMRTRTCAVQVELETKVKEIQGRCIQQDAFQVFLDRGWIKYLDDDEVLHRAPPMHQTVAEAEAEAEAPATPDVFYEPDEYPIASAMATLTIEDCHLEHSGDVEQSSDSRRQSCADLPFFDALETWV